jgi:methionyl-tRNA synthetase
MHQKLRIMIYLERFSGQNKIEVAIYGNFINRVVVLTNKYYNGIVPSPNDCDSVDEGIESLSSSDFKFYRTLPIPRSALAN